MIFLLVGLLYIYILHQWKCNDNLEVFELDYLDSPTQLQNACDLRQPLVMPSFLEPLRLPPARGVLKVGIKDARCYLGTGSSLDAVEMTYEGALDFFASSSPHYFSENNANFLRDSGLLRQVKKDVDAWFQPPNFTVHADYDFLFGNATAGTPFRYHTQNRRYLCVIHGTLRARLAPWSLISSGVKDYEFYEFYSQTPPSTTMEVVVQEGQILYVPPYWWYALDYSGVAVIQCSYMTAMNAVAHAHDLVLCALQRQNIKTHIIKDDKKSQEDFPQKHPNPDAQESVREDVHRADPVEHVETGQGISLEHEIVQ